MPIEPVFEKLSAKEKAGEVVCRVKVECKTDVPATSVEKVLNNNAGAFTVLSGISDGRAEFVCRATFFICFAVADGIRKCECGAEIKDSLLSDGIKEGDEIRLIWNVEKTEIDLSGLKMTAVAHITVKGEIYRKKEYAALTGGEKVFCDLKPIKTVKSYGTVSSTYIAEEEFDLNYPVAEVLSHKAEACITAAQCGVGTVICDGEIYLTEILLQSGDKNDIIRENRVIPFRAEAECEDAMPQLSATCSAFIKSVKTDVSVDEEKNISTVSVSVAVGFTGEAYSVAEETVAVDAFNSEKELTLVKARAATYAESAPACSFVKISGRAAVEDLESARAICAAGEKIEILSATKKDNALNIVGALTVNGLFAGEDGTVFARKSEVPFETAVPCDADGEVGVSVAIKSATVKLITFTETECEAEAVFSVYAKNTFFAEIISEIEEGEPKQIPEAAASVFIPLAGEGLWELAKRLNVCPESLVSTNPELQFPLTGKERIVVYRQK